MKAAVFYGVNDIRIEEREMPKLGPTDVLIKVKACGVCGTDVHIFHGDKGAADVTPPTILGHEFSGVVKEVGPEVKNFKPGDRVSVDPNKYCGHCEPCRSGLVHFCENMTGYGTTTNGGFAEYCAVDERQLYKLGDGTGFVAGAMTEPLACCLHGIDMCGIKPGSHVLVIGAGMIGLLIMQLAKLSGASKVAVIELVQEKLLQAKHLGADLVIDPAKDDPAETLENAGFGHIDTVIECVGMVQTINQAIQLAGYKATVMMFGLTAPDDVLSLKPFDVFRKELTLKASYINPCTCGRALDLINTGRIDVSSMVAEVCGLEKLPQILADPALRARGKYVISPEL